MGRLRARADWGSAALFQPPSLQPPSKRQTDYYRRQAAGIGDLSRVTRKSQTWTPTTVSAFSSKRPRGLIAHPISPFPVKSLILKTSWKKRARVSLNSRRGMFRTEIPRELPGLKKLHRRHPVVAPQRLFLFVPFTVVLTLEKCRSI